MSRNVVYAIVKAGGRQEKVSVGDVVTVDKLDEEIGADVHYTPLLVVDGDAVTTKAEDLAKITVHAKVTAATKGPKISIVKFKNKTGYRKRMGHREQRSVITITSIA